MPDEINEGVDALQQLISILETARTQMQETGGAIEGITNLILSLKDAVDDVASVIPKIEQITVAINALKGEGPSRVRLGDIGQKRLERYGQAYREAQQEQQAEPRPIKTENLEKIKQVSKETGEEVIIVGDALDRLARGEDEVVTSTDAMITSLRLVISELKDLGNQDDAIKEISTAISELKAGELDVFDTDDLKEYLEALGATAEEVNKITENFNRFESSLDFEELRDKLKGALIDPESIDQVIVKIAKLGTTVSDFKVSTTPAAEGMETLRVSFLSAFENTEPATKAFKFTLDEVKRTIIDTSKAATQGISPLREFVEGLKDVGVPRVERRKIVEETFGEGVTDTSKIRITPLEGELRKLSTTLQVGSKVTQAYTVVIDELGRVIEDTGQKAGKSQLRQFAEGLKAAGAPRQVRRQIIEETTGQGIEGISGTRITEVDDKITRLNTTLKLGGEITKAYVLYWDDLGETFQELPVKDATISIKDFTDQLSGRVGAIDNVTKMMEKYGFELSDLKKMSTEASTGITKLDFSMKGMGGATENLTLHVTEFGKVLTDTQRRFRTFAGGIVRNIGHSFQWAIAITAIYGPLRKLQDLIQISIDNESKLADIGIVLGKGTEEIQHIFEDAAVAAQATGESLNGVIEGYALAYRATGSITNQTERAEVANQLLIDSLILSKLSTLDQANAMDTLVAGLLQVGYELDQGGELLNKWVAVSKAANVSVDTLASSFAIMATAAEGVGLDFDELNAIIAVVAANTELSATQAGNAVRAFVSGFQTNNARDELSKFGIAVKTLDGDARDFMAVMYDIKALMDAGLISEAEINRIGTALGGRGARRGAQFTTFLKSLNEVQGYVTVSANAQEDAYDALGIKMDTVQTAITNLATSFQVLANAVGTDGGILGILKGLLEILDDITKAATSFVEVMGKAAPFLAAAGGLYAYGTIGTNRVSQMPQQLGRLVAGGLGRTQYGQQPQGGGGQMAFPGFGVQATTTGKTMAQVWGQRATQYAPYIGLAMVQGMMAGINIKDKDWDGLGGQIGGGIAGFLIGGPIGSIIGSTIGESFMNAVMETTGEWEDLFKGIIAKALEEAPDDPDLTQEERILKEMGDLQVRIIETAGGEFAVSIDTWGTHVDNWIRGVFGLQKQFQEGITDIQYAGDVVQKGAFAAEKGPQEFRQFELDEGINLFAGTSEEDIKQRAEAFKELNAEMLRLDKVQEAVSEDEFLPGGALSTELQRNSEKYADFLENVLIDLQEEFRTSLIDAEIVQKAYTESMERMGDTGESILSIFTVLNDVFGDSEEVLASVADVISRTTRQEIDDITILTTGIDDLAEEIAKLEEEGDIDLKLIAEGELEEAYFQLEQLFNQIRTAQRVPLIQLQTPTALDIKPEEYELVREEALRILKERLQEQIRLGLIPDNTTIEEFIATGEIMAVAFADFFGDAMRSELSTVLDVFPEAIENLAIPGAIAPPVSADEGLQVRTIEQTQGAFMAAYERQYQLLKDSFGDLYQGDFSTVGIIFSDGVDVLHLDNLAMQLAMNDLIDISQKQLEGVYNLPTDASFYVPFQGYKLGFGDGGGAGGDLSGAADQLKEAAYELKSLDIGEDWGQTLEGAMREMFPQFMRDEKPGPYDFRQIDERKERLLERERIPEEMSDTWQLYAEDMMSIYRDNLPPPSIFDQILQAIKNLAADGTTLPTPPIPPIDRTPAELPPSPIPPIQEPTESILGKFFEFINNLFLGTSPIPGIGQGAGIGPTFEFSKLDSAATKLDNFATTLQPQFQALGPPAPFGGTTNLATEFSGVLDLLNQKISNLSGFTTNLKISSTYTANLIVDGRTLAQIIKPYLYSDLIRFEDSAASVTKTIVV